jgi:hypothetical protein
MWGEHMRDLTEVHSRIDTLAECLVKMGCNPAGVLTPSPIQPCPETTDELVARLLADPKLAAQVFVGYSLGRHDRQALVDYMQAVISAGDLMRTPVRTLGAAIALASFDPRP